MGSTVIVFRTVWGFAADFVHYGLSSATITATDRSGRDVERPRLLFFTVPGDLSLRRQCHYNYALYHSYEQTLTSIDLVSPPSHDSGSIVVMNLDGILNSRLINVFMLHTDLRSFSFFSMIGSFATFSMYFFSFSSFLAIVENFLVNVPIYKNLKVITRFKKKQYASKICFKLLSTFSWTSFAFRRSRS